VYDEIKLQIEFLRCVSLASTQVSHSNATSAYLITPHPALSPRGRGERVAEGS
jgi:hypothetical protein